MRNLKFRATRNDTKETFEVLNLDWLHGTVFLAGNMIEVDLDDVAIQQFTGLQDKDGVDIYEGDTLKSYHYTDSDGIDYFIAHTVEWSEKLNGWYMVGEDDQGDGDGSLQAWVYMKSSSSIETIGNVHEVKHAK